MIGRGAHGVVHRARDTALGREVALKQPSPGARSSPGGDERFLHEARSAAGLRHPNIVAVHDVGTWDGEPYLVTALVNGTNLAEELSRQRPSFRQSSEWVASLSDALDHAHRRGVIHRDVKPSNVLLDRNGEVFLTDFGLAKSQEERASLTISGQLIGTPAYMSPEQAGANLGPIDVRTDVYSLGVILYELLTGVRPFQGTERIVLTRIREEDPRPPRRLDDTIPRDLETVCLKAMAKNPGHRYATAAEFATDLRRWLHGEPVLARPVGPFGMLWRKCRRVPVVSGLAASLVLAVVLGFIGVTWEWRRAEAFRRRAEINLGVAREERRHAQANFADAEQQRLRAVRALAEGTRTLTTLTDLTDERMLGKPVPSRETLWNLLYEHYRGFVQQLKGDPAFHRDLAHTSLRVASLLEGSGSMERANAVWKETQVLYEGLVRQDPADLDYRARLSECQLRLGLNLRQTARPSEGDDSLRQGMEVCRETLELAKRRLGSAPGDRAARATLANAELRFGEFGRLLGRSEEAIKVLRLGRDRSEQLLREFPAEAEYRELVARSGYILAQLIRDSEPEESVSVARSVRDHYEIILRVYPLDAATLRHLADAQFWLASLEDRADRMEEALRDFWKAAELYQRLHDNKPYLVGYRGGLGVTYHNIGHILVEIGRPAESLEPYRKAIPLRESLVQLDPENIAWRCDCTGSWYRLGEALQNLGRIPEAVEAYQKCLAHQKEVYSREPGEIKHRNFLDERLKQLFWLRLALGRTTEAAAMARERKALWPNEPGVALTTAVQLLAASLSRSSDESLWQAIASRERRRYASEALGALRDAARLKAGKSLVSRSGP